MRNSKELEQMQKGEIGDLNSPDLEAWPTPKLRVLSLERQRRSYSAAAFSPTPELHGHTSLGPTVPQYTATGQLYDSTKDPSAHAPNAWVDIEAAERLRQESDDRQFLADYSTLPRLKKDEQRKATLARLMGYLYFLIGCWYFKKRTSASTVSEPCRSMEAPVIMLIAPERVQASPCQMDVNLEKEVLAPP